MNRVWYEIRLLLAAGGAPCLGFLIGMLISFAVYPEDMESASNLVMICAGAGALVGIFLVVQRLRKLFGEIDE